MDPPFESTRPQGGCIRGKVVLRRRRILFACIFLPLQELDPPLQDLQELDPPLQYLAHAIILTMFIDAAKLLWNRRQADKLPKMITVV